MLEMLLNGEDVLTDADVAFVENALGMSLSEELDED